MLTRTSNPIVAIATAPGRGAVGIVRVSGQGLGPLARALCGRDLRPRVATYGPFLDADGLPIDHGLALYFPAPHSYTGEDVLELQAHGGPVVLQLLVARCLEAAAQADADPVDGVAGGGGEAEGADAARRQPGRPRLPELRLAEPGEFTQRAFLNDKIDLAQAEAIADLIDASTEAAARSASRSLSGAFSREVDALREALLQLRMLVEATLDFPEEEIDFLTRADAQGKLERTAATLQAVLAQARSGALLRDGLTVVLAGQPNVGKSSLLNALAGAELAIVTPVAGTTRDKVRETIQIEGVPLHVVDTAGLRADEDAADEVERIGIARSWEAIRAADAVLFLHDLTRIDDPAYRAAEDRIAERLLDHGVAAQAVLHVFNKVDCAVPEGASELLDLSRHAAAKLPEAFVHAPRLALSAHTGAGLHELRRALLERVGWQAAPEGVFIARQRHVQALKRAQQHLLLAADWARQGDAALDLLAEELRLAHDALGTITGAVTADELLGEIFTRFCIGK